MEPELSNRVIYHLNRWLKDKKELIKSGEDLENYETALNYCSSSERTTEEIEQIERFENAVIEYYKAYHEANQLSVYFLELHESITVRKDKKKTSVMRVPGGWIYKFSSKQSDPNYVFVPYPTMSHAEYEQLKETYREYKQRADEAYSTYTGMLNNNGTPQESEAE